MVDGIELISIYQIGIRAAGSCIVKRSSANQWLLFVFSASMDTVVVIDSLSRDDEQPLSRSLDCHPAVCCNSASMFGRAAARTGHIIGGTRNAGDFGGYLVKMEADGEIQGYFTDGTNPWSVTTSGTDYRSDTEFHHFALTWQDGAGDNSTGYAELYIDGNLEASGSAPSAFSPTDADAGDQAFIIGGRNAASENTWEGRFDEFRFSNVALATTEFLYAETLVEMVGGDLVITDINNETADVIHPKCLPLLGREVVEY